MHDFFSQLNLQNLLRQFCCGIIFFVPLYLFVPSEFGKIWANAGLESEQLSCVAVLAFIIGTVIYHLEKNLYSYFIQLLFESVGPCLLGAAVIIFIVGIIALVFIGTNISLLITIIVFLAIVASIICMLVLFLSADFNPGIGTDHTDKKYHIIVNKLILRTELSWMVEYGAEGVSKKQQAIAKKVSVWSDFIHCVQSSCFSWILGTIAAYYLHPCRLCGCTGDCCVYIQQMCMGLLIAVFILLVEIGIDAHRYIHVRRMATYFPCETHCVKLCPMISMRCRKCHDREKCFKELKRIKNRI